MVKTLEKYLKKETENTKKSNRSLILAKATQLVNDAKKEIDKLLKDKIFKKLVDEYKKKIKRQAKDINKQQKQFYKTLEKIVKIRKKFEKQLEQLKR